MNPEPSKRKAGRPKNPKLDEIQAELACTRRHAKRILADMSRNIANSAKPGEPSQPASPIAAARLTKLLKETELLESKVRQAVQDERLRDGELITLDTAQALFCKPLQVLRDQLGTLSKRFSVRLHGQTIKSIETMLADECDRIVSLARGSV